jgi:hypothetical protein
MITLSELYRSVLTETTYDIDSDVDLIYTESGMEKFLTDFKNSGYRTIPNEDFKILDSSILKCPKSVEAHAANPIKIITAISGITPHYSMKDHEITLSVHPAIIGLYRDEYNTGFSHVNPRQVEALKNELSESRRKATIYHELSHWISDSTHNFHLTNMMKIAQEPGSHKDLQMGKYDVGETYYEIDAQIHGIKQIKRRYTPEEWNSMSLERLFTEYVPLDTIKNRLKKSENPNELRDWLRKLLTRMHREGLLGNNMKKY